MRILYYSQYYPPEVGATQTRAHEMATFLAGHGHHVTVVTEVPNHPSGIIPPHYRGRLSERKTEDGVDVLRLWVRASPEKGFRARMLFYLSYMGMGALAGALLRGRYDLVYATSPPLFAGSAGLAAATFRRIPFVFEVRDLWPESAVALGELRNAKAIRAAELLEALLYRRAVRVVAVTEGIRNRLLTGGVPPGKVALITNGANTDHFRYDPHGASRIASELGLSGKFIAMYAGIHGLAQGLETVLEAADLLRDRGDIAFVFIGEGPRKADLLETKTRLGLENVAFLPEVASAAMPAYLSGAGCAIVPLRDERVFRGALPSKLFEAWACGRPVVLSAAGEAADLVEHARGGVVTPPEQPQPLAAAIAYIADNPAKAAEMGQRGHDFVVRHYSRSEQAARLEELLMDVLKQSRVQP